MSDNSTKERHPLSLNLRNNMCPIRPQNNDSKQVLISCMYDIKRKLCARQAQKKGINFQCVTEFSMLVYVVMAKAEEQTSVLIV